MSDPQLVLLAAPNYGDEGLGQTEYEKILNEDGPLNASGASIVDGPRLGRKGERELMENAKGYIQSLNLAVITFMMTDKYGNQFLNVLSLTPDLYWTDQAALRMNCVVNSDGKLVCHIVTPNREVVRQMVIDHLESELKDALEDLVNQQYQACVGYTEGHEMFSKLRKTDIPNMLIERYDGALVYRARTCRFVVQRPRGSDPDDDTAKHCDECIKFYSELDVKYCQRKVAPHWLFGGEERPKRGRPKASPGKPVQEKVADAVAEAVAEAVEETLIEADESIMESEEAEQSKESMDHKENLDPIPEEEDVEVKEEEEEEEEEEDLAMFDDPDDEDYGELPGFRRRITTKRQKALLVERKRGRPPLMAGPVECTDCGRFFDNVKDYRKHCKEHTNSFACEYKDCIKRFKSQRELDIHVRKHNGEKPYVCQECNKAYQTRQDLRLHFRKHTGERPFKCELCEKRFARAQQRKIHMVVHTKDRAFLCQHCGSRFGSASTLIDHKKRRHLKVRNHKCAQCTREFFTRQELEAHVRTHTGEKPYNCQFCGKSFSRTHHLKRHIDGVHKGSKVKKPATTTQTFYLPTSDVKTSPSQMTSQMTSLLKLGDDTAIYVTEAGEGEYDEDGDTQTVQISIDDGNIVGTEYVVDNNVQEVKLVPGLDRQLVLQKLHLPPRPSSDDAQSIQYLSGDAASSLIELAKEPRTILLQSDQLIEDAGGQVVVVNTEDGQEIVQMSAAEYSQLVDGQQIAVVEEEEK